MNNKSLTIGLIVVAIIAIIGVYTPVAQSVSSLFGATSYCPDSQTTCLPSMQFTGNQNTAVPSVQIDSGKLLQSSAATTTSDFLSTSSTKGWCAEFNATSTNTLLNMTFGATSSPYTASGVTSNVNYGACR